MWEFKGWKGSLYEVLSHRKRRSRGDRGKEERKPQIGSLGGSIIQRPREKETESGRESGLPEEFPLSYLQGATHGRMAARERDRKSVHWAHQRNKCFRTLASQSLITKRRQRSNDSAQIKLSNYTVPGNNSKTARRACV